MPQVNALEKQARDVLREVVILRNSLRPVNRLPPEVLASCVSLVSDADPTSTLPLTHVCQYWRNSITSSPRIWASIATRWKRLTPLCLERAGAVPLAVNVTMSDIEDDEDFLEQLTPHTSRIGTLRLIGYPTIETLANDLPGFFDSPMLDLTFLELEQTEEPVNIFPSDEATVPPVFRNVSKVKSLSLTRTPIFPPLFSLAFLKELKLTAYANPFDFGTFSRFLRANPNVENLVLNVQFIEDTIDAAPARQKVSLPHLRSLSITCSKAADSKGLLSRMSLPRGVHIEIESLFLDQSVELSSFLPSPLTPIKELLCPITTINIQKHPRVFHFIGNSSTFTFRSQHTSDLSSSTDWMLLPTAAVREFFVDFHPSYYTDAGMLKAMEHLPALETLVISKMTSAALPPALTAEPVLCPALKTIAFFDCNIDSGIVEELGAAIAKRRDSTGTRLYRVVIVSSRGTQLNAESIQKLRKSVPYVDIRVDDKLPDLS